MLQRNLGSKIRKLRKSKGMSQAKLAELIGIDDKHLSRIELGKHFPTYTVLKNLAKVLDFDVYNLEDMPESNIIMPDKTYLSALKILNSAKTKQEKHYYLKVLQLAQQGLKIGKNNDDKNN